ncbi:MAG: large-conductance mechanosensitive channel protein MscL [Bacteroidetes bacterium]|nr:large-conductance mechanosensitive channel protein MscL [Bacteroidota bacterium]MBV6461450.1 Large-conductance mechanosensitive channel [Flavobacteriales bacterium]WKZ76554.1 MAG: large-conductance mechanosensitive channel protein MscL [Vicingaceae bacterium]MCL4815627.1 large-conductance mechanosensitive channel protein MscL [Flavobacteriales bacterium]NOG94235.1 large-conductance mechanosensitive channel protein MscL [Bacteroidota bacterium]
MKILNEFKTFATRGNVVDLAVGVIIGGAFGKIVASLVNDIIMPPIGVLIGGVSFTDLSFTLLEAVKDENHNVIKEAVKLNYGMFIQNIFDFTIIAFSVFLLIKGINRLKKKEEEKPAAPAEPPVQEKLLAEIRDLLKK